MKEYKGWIIIVILILIGATYFYINENNNKKLKNVDDDIVDNEKDSQINSNSNTESSNNNNSASNSSSNQNSLSNASTTKKDSLKCTKTEKIDYGTIYYTNNYKFKSDKMTYGEGKIEVKLSSKYTSHRDQLLSEIKNSNKSFVALNGISESSTKNSSGFTYILKIDGTKVSATDLKNMGYKTLNYSGVKLYAYNNSFKCE